MSVTTAARLQSSPDSGVGRIDVPMVVAIGVVAYALSNIIHETIGHGGACVAVGRRLLEVSAIHADCDVAGRSASVVAAAGTLANLCAGGLAWLGLLRTTRRREWGYFLWLLMSVNLLQATGYLLFSGIGNVGDWAQIVSGLEPAALYRAPLAIVGIASYCLVIVVSLRTLNRLLGNMPERLRKARALAVIPYVAGGALYLAAGALNPVSPVLILISAAAASFGGTSALAWMTALLRTPRFPPQPGAPLTLQRSNGWLGAAIAVVIVFVVVLGRGLQF